MGGAPCPEVGGRSGGRGPVVREGVHLVFPGLCNIGGEKVWFLKPVNAISGRWVAPNQPSKYCLRYDLKNGS